MAARFVNYYQYLGITQFEDRVSARRKVLQALLINHPDKWVTKSKHIQKVVIDKTCILNEAKETFSSDQSLGVWRFNNWLCLNRWFRDPGSSLSATTGFFDPVEYLTWGSDDPYFFNIKGSKAKVDQELQGPNKRSKLKSMKVRGKQGSKDYSNRRLQRRSRKKRRRLRGKRSLTSERGSQRGLPKLTIWPMRLRLSNSASRRPHLKGNISSSMIVMTMIRTTVLLPVGQDQRPGVNGTGQMASVLQKMLG